MRLTDSGKQIYFQTLISFFYHQQNQDPNQIHFVSNHDNIELSIISPQVLPSFSSILLQFSTFYTVSCNSLSDVDYLPRNDLFFISFFHFVEEYHSCHLLLEVCLDSPSQG